MIDFQLPTLPLRAVVFDLDGLMFNTEELYQEVGSTVLARRGFDFPAGLLNEMMGRQSDKALQIMIDWHKLTDTVETLAAESMQVMHELIVTRLKPMPGLLDLLEALESADVDKAIATSSGREFLDRVLDLSKLTDRFAFTIAGSEIEHGKPAPDIYLLAAQRHGCQPAEMMVLEDSQIGCQAAVAADTFAVAVPGGHSHSHEFHGVRFIAQTLADARIYRALGITQR